MYEFNYQCLLESMKVVTILVIPWSIEILYVTMY